ncbi:BMP family ABC transporter substrate-binding protein [soil metagenome]
MLHRAGRQRVGLASGIAVAALILAACAGNDEGSESSASICNDANGEGPKVGLAYDVGGRGDQSFNDSAYAGLEKAVNELEATCTESEAALGEDDDQREERLRQLADEGYDPIIAVGYIYSPNVDTVAAEPDYSDVSFAVVEGYAEAPTATNFAFAANEGSFLVGVAAALKTETNNVGFLGGVNNALIQDFEAGFVAGVEAVDPSIEIQSQYLTQDPDATDEGFENPTGGETAATGMYDNGADIIYHVAGKSGLGLFAAAVQAGEGKWAIGVDSDQYLTADEDQKAHILTSMLKRVDVSVFDYIQAYETDNVKTGYVTYDLKSDGVGYATSGGFIDDITDQIDDYKQQIIDGEIKVPTAPQS